MFPSRQGGTLKPEKRESRTMSWHGVYSRMHDDARSKPFRNCAQIVVSEKSLIYSAFSRPGENTRTEIPITWLEESTFIVDWTRVCRHWSTAATFHQHSEKGVRGFLEQGLHFWRYDPVASREMQKTPNHIKDAHQNHLLFLPHGQAYPLLTTTPQHGRRRLPLRQQQTSSPTRSAGQTCTLILTGFRGGQPYLLHGQAHPLVTVTSLLRRRLLPPSPQTTTSAGTTSTLQGTAPSTCS